MEHDDNNDEPECLRGYRAVLLEHNGVRMKQFTIPNREAFVTDPDHKLLVVNGVPRFLVKTAVEVQTCLNKHTLEQRLQAWTVTDVAQGTRFATEEDVRFINDDFLFLNVEAATPDGKRKTWKELTGQD